MTDQPPAARNPNLAGTWRKITTAECARKYPQTIAFAESTYRGTRGEGQALIWWDAGIYRLEGEGTLLLSVASDELVRYSVALSADRLDVVDADGCRFSYQREGR